jgi:ABC-type lipoprotein export system ATPase subunit
VPLLRFKRVSKSYGTAPALVDVSLDVERGEFVALAGRSGCGKSTLLNVAGAMDFPTSGEVVLDGVVTSSLGEAALTRLRREKVGFVFQSFQLLPSLSVVENVEMPLLLARRARARETALDCLKQVEMEDYARECLTSFPAARCSAWPSPAPWSTRRRCCWPTNPPATWTAPPATSSCNSCGALPTRKRRPS